MPVETKVSPAARGLTDQVAPREPKAQATAFDPLKVRSEFPILQTQVYGKPLVYLDNGATTQKPRQVIDALRGYYDSQNANIHRAVYALSQLATNLYEETRHTIGKFLNASDDREIIYTRGTTESINLVAQSYGRSVLKSGDEVVISAMEHHSNIVPWQMVCQQTGAKLRVIPMNDSGELLLDEYEKILAGGRAKIVSVVHVSNSLGTINDVKGITTLAHAHGAKVLIDGAQWVAHFPTDVREIGCDFYAFSGHKLFAPTGIGALYGRLDLLESMPPYQGGGDMIRSVTFEKTEYADPPSRFEAGTPHIAGVVGLGAAIDYVTRTGLQRSVAYEHELLEYATDRLSEVPGLRIIGTAREKSAVISFVMEDPPLASHDIGVILDMAGVCIRTGHHCCQPVMDRMGIASTARLSLAMYNTRDDIDACAQALWDATGKARQSPKGRPIEQIEYPQASAPSPQAAADELAEIFELLGDDPNAKSLYVMDDLGAKLPNLFELLKKVTPRIEGCMSQVYLVGRRSPKDPQVLELVADADAAIVRGEIAMLLRLFSGQKAGDILAFDTERFFRRIGLEQFISSQRRNGLGGMIQRIHLLAREITRDATA
jgi:cysteine desulfurase/selenocysteine lyase